MSRKRHTTNDASEPAVDRIADDALWSQLVRPIPAPDLTRPIMGRLGFMKAAPAVTRRRRIRRWATRAGLTCAASLAIALAWQSYVKGPDVRRPTGPTIPAAIGHDIQRQQHRIGSMIHTIRNLSPRPPQPSVEEAPPDSAPLRDQRIDEDVNRSSIAIVRWV